ncbi:hypothetical protein DET57_10933 [Klebsiella oxytoca]|uniref:Lipoprotein n=1 Tax=Klebsiella oxytoca TaxID=571 RepID=A0A318FLG1_KLEOX|nr:hypothetical protein [Klebsiella oxytoca]PXW44350.1 hypothetical protein DET57_10933 [Klebsiella oxytoca]HCB1500579.1 hypothetical protein [Klebsiella michiganensis]HCB1846744.1 hypothetical protein [Klebsiella oxytoca]
MDIKKLRFCGLMFILFLTSCDNGQQQTTYPMTQLKHQQWLSEIQRRFDAANRYANQAVCIITPKRLKTEFTSWYRPTAGILWFIQQGLVEEKIEIEAGKYTNYYYRLTDKGAASSPNWPYSRGSGLCFGSVQVERISRITPANDLRTTDIEFIYRINGVPDWAQELMPQLFPDMKEGKISGSARFDMADNTHLRCLSGIGNYYVDEDKFFNTN